MTDNRGTSKSRRIGVAILGSGNIGTDLLYKVRRSDWLELRLVSGIVPESAGLGRARQEGIPTSTSGAAAVAADPYVQLVFDATSASAAAGHAPVLEEAGKKIIDLTPAALGPYVVPAVNGDVLELSPNVNLITCAGQATIPIVAAVADVVPVAYAEIVSAVSSASAGPGTRANIDEFTRTTTDALRKVGGAASAKTIVVLNPAEPKIMMRNTIYLEVESALGTDDEVAVREAITRAMARVQEYVPGYRAAIRPECERSTVKIALEVTGRGDYLPPYAGNLDIMTAAAVAVAEGYSRAEQSALAGRSRA